MAASWTSVFVMAAAVDAFGLVAFCVLGRGVRQWWD